MMGLNLQLKNQELIKEDYKILSFLHIIVQF